jgi:type I pantothenate kinase
LLRWAPPCERGRVGDPYVELSNLLGPGIERCRAQQVPYVLAITGSVAVGKSTTARLVREALVTRFDGLRAEVVSTDGFLYPNKVIDARGLSVRKGFPETYDRDALLAVLAALKAGARDVRVPLYSHEAYDVLDEYQALERDDVVVLEGLHLIDLSDAIDFTVYVDADEADIERWFVQRFLELRESNSFYRQFAGLPDDETIAFARQVWASINGVNLHEHILPARPFANAVFEKAPDHSVKRLIVNRESMTR